MQVTEGGYLLVTIKDCSRGFASDDLAKDTIGIKSIHEGSQSCEKVDEIRFHRRNSTRYIIEKMQNKPLDSIKRDIQRYFGFLFDKGYEFRDAHYHEDAFGNWEITLESQNNAIEIYMDRLELMLAFRPKGSVRKYDIGIEPMIFYLTNERSFMPPFEGNLSWRRKKQFERLSRLTLEWIVKAEPYFGPNFSEHGKELLAAQRKYNDLCIKTYEKRHRINWFKDKTK